MSDLQVRMHGKTAVVTGAYHEKGTQKGKPYEYRDRFTDVWMNLSGRLASDRIALQPSRQPVMGNVEEARLPEPSEIDLVFFVSDCPDLRYNGAGLNHPSLRRYALEFVMPLNWHTPSLDEQFFQSVLSAAFTIQEHNERQKLAGQTPARQAEAGPEAHAGPRADGLCEHCGALLPADTSRCGSCGLEGFCPEERMPPNWASMWLMSQGQSLWPQHSPEIREGPRTGVPPLDVEREPLAQVPRDSAGPSFLVLPAAKEAAKETVGQEKIEAAHDQGSDTSALDKAEAKSQTSTEAIENLTPEDLAPENLAAKSAELNIQPFQLFASDDATTGAPADASIKARGASTDLLNCVPDHVLRVMVQQALQATHASGAALALERQGELICRAAVGDLAFEIGKMIDTGSGFTGVCTSGGTMQLCSNTALDSRVDAAACRKLGVSAIIVVPLFHQDQWVGLITVFSRRPYAFGMRDLQALQDLAERFAANLELRAGSANVTTGHESPGAL